ncbi:lytic polysaccharide monooxygenase [Patellaria atrata CBS 101060]|uniref:lytic cellulose monooxygenase (C4-dehydrogenating) n=1 Tax=Patellaria atrata CBS 101060 TaxID=1346257 RepID=A0A9P4S2E5_9PEZI|nr:lytic polysaccharide monooxygenase [Patellaria atrata CBS 101060]
MRKSLFSIALGLTAQGVDAHYTFSKLIVNGTVTEDWKYVRKVFRDPLINADYGMISPHYDLYHETMRCGRQAARSGPTTETAIVEAGDEVGFESQVAFLTDYLQYPDIFHPGPGQAYLSKAPADLETYVGDGDWFKIASITSKSDTEWALLGETQARFTIPKTTPPGKYLLRFEHIFLNTYFNNTQYYQNCAHVEIVGPGGGTPGPTIKFPGGYDNFDRGLWVPEKAMANPPSYTPPGPPVWTG